MLQPIFDKVAGLQSATLLKKTPAQVFSSEFCETFFKEHLRAATSIFLTVFFFLSKLVRMFKVLA